MKNKNLRGILALCVVTALSFGVIIGSRALSHNLNPGEAVTENSSEQAAVLEELDTAGAENIEKAVRTDKGYTVTVKKDGYAGQILLQVSFDESASQITGVEVLEQNETQNLGALIAEEDFLGQFAGVKAPVYLSGMTVENPFEAAAQESQEAPLVLTDGVYEAKTETADDSGYIGELTMTVTDGKIAAVVWDYVDGAGNRKSVQSENGEYVMTEDGPTWKEQAESLGAALVEAQSLEALGMQDNGKTDAVSGVSINIMEFVTLAEQCLQEASGTAAETTEDAGKTTQEGTLADAVSGATISSTAAVKGINEAYFFLQANR